LPQAGSGLREILLNFQVFENDLETGKEARRVSEGERRKMPAALNRQARSVPHISEKRADQLTRVQ
jgi:hypothetical protein